MCSGRRRGVEWDGGWGVFGVSEIRTEIKMKIKAGEKGLQQLKRNGPQEFTTVECLVLPQKDLCGVL